MAATTLSNAILGSKIQSSKVSRVSVPRTSAIVCAQKDESRRSMIALLAASVIATTPLAANAVSKVVVEGPPAPIGGLPGTDSSDQARDTNAPLKERFYLQTLDTEAALERVKSAAARIAAVKPLIAKKAFPVLRAELRSSVNYLRFDLATIIATKPKSEKKVLDKSVDELIAGIEALDYAARVKNPASAEQTYTKAIALLDSVIASLA